VLLPFIAAAIKLESPGPVFYRQMRAGQGGRPFQLLKFRTMIAGAEADGQARWARAIDARVTRVGRLLRRTRLDELPQLFNVLRGDMSLIGPRPERPELIAVLEQEIPFYRARLLVKPGLTGWAQVNYGYGRSVEDARVKLEYDLYYIKQQSIWLDLVILFRTVEVVLGMKGS
jgi:lipopolysaccharide/colanic/teichoic acid biosynthesis glycosyltransferase